MDSPYIFEMEHIETYFNSKPNSDFRIFRDDGILYQQESLTQCSRCSRWFWPDEMQDSLCQENLCRLCADLIDSRVKSLNKKEKTKCPINPKDWIFTKEYHSYKGRGKL